MNVENEAISGKLDTNSGQVQSLNDSVDELKTRIAKLEKTIGIMQSQLQNIQNPPQVHLRRWSARRRVTESRGHRLRSRARMVRP